MRVNYLFPVFKDDNVKGVLEDFLKSDFFKKYEDYKFVFCCNKDDKENLKYLKNKSKLNKKYKIIVFDKSFSYNDAFDESITFLDGDIVLLGDFKIQKIDVVFERCLEKYKKGASIVHVVKKREGFKGFFVNLVQSCYNFFIKIFTNKKDRLNITSLGLLNKDVVDLLKVLPKKRCFLKNTKDLMGFESRTIYVSSKTLTYKPNFKTKTGSLITSLVSAGVFGVTLICLVLLNCFLVLPTFVNIIFIILAFVCLVLVCMLLPKHFFDIRNFKTKNISYEIKEIN